MQGLLTANMRASSLLKDSKRRDMTVSRRSFVLHLAHTVLQIHEDAQSYTHHIAFIYLPAVFHAAATRIAWLTRAGRRCAQSAAWSSSSSSSSLFS
jgi:hypothetical protein